MNNSVEATIENGDINSMPIAGSQPSLELWLDFISRFIEALAWPVAIFFIAFLFRNELKSVASNLKRLKWGDAEAVFDEGVAEAKEVARTLDPVDPSTSSKNDNQTYSLLQQAEVSPTGAVIEAYKRVEQKLWQIFNLAQNEPFAPSSVGSMRWSDPKKTPLLILTRVLQNSGWVSSAEIKMLERLRETRNLAVHSRKKAISQKSAKEFVKLAGVFEDTLQSKIDGIQTE